MRKRMRGTLAAAAAVLVLSGLGTAALPVSAASRQEAESEKKKLESSLKEAQELVDDLKKDQKQAKDSVEALDAQLTEISQQIVSLKNKMKTADQEIRKTEKELKAAQQKEQEQSESMKARIKYTYENFGSMNYITMLLESDSFIDFLNYAFYMNAIMEYDRAQLEAYAKTKQLIADSKEKLEKNRAELKEMEAQVKEEKQAVDLLMEEKENQLQKITENLSDTEALAAEYKAEIAAQDAILAQIKKAEEEKKNQTDKNSGKPSSGGSENIDPSDSYTDGEFLWPCPASRRVTSDYGKRPSPKPGASSFHKGIDIGAPYGSAIVAVADGVVFTAAYQPNGAGNYTVISHGGGVYTVYMHCSSLAVSLGQKVKRGQTIAYVGSTGISTGNHLHFGVQVNGAYVNPWSYLK